MTDTVHYIELLIMWRLDRDWFKIVLVVVVGGSSYLGREELLVYLGRAEED